MTPPTPMTLKTMPPEARSGAILGVLREQLAKVAGGLSDPKLANPIRYFAGAAAWAEQTLSAPQRAAEHTGRLEELSEQARQLLGGEPSAFAINDAAQLIERLSEAVDRGVAGARQLLDEVLCTARTIEEGPTDSAAPQQAVAAPGPLSVDQVSAYLRRRFGADAQAHELHTIPGGFSKHTILASATFAGRRQDIVFRQVPKGRHEEDLPLEFNVIRHAWAVDRPIPEPLWIEPGHNDLGGPFLVTRKMPGSTLGDVFGPTTQVPETFCLDLADFLAQLHRLDVTRIENTPVRSMRTPHEILQAIDEMAGRADEAAGIAPRLAAVFGWLRAHIPDTGERPSLLHGDVGLHNALSEGGRLTALLDWERSHIGDPAEDLAYLRPTLEQAVPWQAFIDRYVQAGGKAPDPRAERFYTVWQDTWRHVQCLTHAANFFNTRSVPSMVAGVVFAPRFLASAVQTAFSHAGARTGGAT